jgi:hypothetical protein
MISPPLDARSLAQIAVRQKAVSEKASKNQSACQLAVNTVILL